MTITKEGLVNTIAMLLERTEVLEAALPGLLQRHFRSNLLQRHFTSNQIHSLTRFPGLQNALLDMQPRRARPLAAHVAREATALVVLPLLLLVALALPPSHRVQGALSSVVSTPATSQLCECSSTSSNGGALSDFYMNRSGQGQSGLLCGAKQSTSPTLHSSMLNLVMAVEL